MLRRLLVVPAVALLLTAFAGPSRAQVGPYLTWCYASGAGSIPAGYHIVPGRDFYSILCPGPQGVKNAWLLAPN
jgi:hypothetical protein